MRGQLTEYQKGQRDIEEWLAHNPRKELLLWKIRVCMDNYPTKSRYQPYYDAMLVALCQRIEVHEQPGQTTVEDIQVGDAIHHPATRWPVLRVEVQGDRVLLSYLDDEGRVDQVSVPKGKQWRVHRRVQEGEHRAESMPS